MKEVHYLQIPATSSDSHGIALPIANLTLEPSDWRHRFQFLFDFVADDTFEDFLATLIECSDGTTVKRFAIVRLLSNFGTSIWTNQQTTDKTRDLKMIVNALSLEKSEFKWIHPEVNAELIWKQ